MKTAKSTPIPLKSAQSRASAEEETWVQSCITIFNREILNGLQVEAADRERWTPVLQWFREALISWSMFDMRELLTMGVLGARDTRAVESVIFTIRKILERGYVDRPDKFSLQGALAMSTRCSYPSQYVAGFHTFLRARIGGDELSAAEVLKWIDEHLIVHALCERGFRRHIGIPESIGTEASAAAKCLAAWISGCVSAHWDGEKMGFAFSPRIRRSFPAIHALAVSA